MKLHKKVTGRVRHIKWNDECYVNASDIVDMFDKWDNEPSRRISKYFNEIILDCSNLVVGMSGRLKQEWNNTMKPN